MQGFYRTNHPMLRSDLFPLDHTLNADLHCHSQVSDGTLTPEDLAERAARQGVRLWALTDHDEVGGVQRARTAALAHGMAFLTGVEVSVTFADVTVHIVGLGFDEHHPALQQGLAQTRSGRALRAQKMGEDLARVGIKNAYEGSLRYVGNPDLISRTHLARFLVDEKHCKDTHEVFRKYLTEGKPGYVPHRWATLRDAVTWIVQAGGLAIIAHPARYAFSPSAEYALFSEFKALGGQGVEVLTSSHSAQEVLKYADMAQEFALCASRGSDFHSPNESHTEFGALPALPTHLRPVWSDLADRISWPASAHSFAGAIGD
jgi:3',5'-nucleoside bisphosphate phosphatase